MRRRSFLSRLVSIPFVRRFVERAHEQITADDWLDGHYDAGPEQPLLASIGMRNKLLGDLIAIEAQPRSLD
jgi:hypothetical protein